MTEDQRVEHKIEYKIAVGIEHAEEMVSIMLAAALALWVNKTDKMGEFAAWLNEHKELIQVGCGDPEHAEPHYPFTRELDGDIADSFLFYFVNYTIPMIRLANEPGTEPVSGPSPYL